MTWNYRIIRKTRRISGKQYVDGKSKLIHFYDIHEVFYNKKNQPDSWTKEPVDANGCETIGDMRISLSIMLTDVLKHPVLEIVRGKLKARKEKHND